MGSAISPVIKVCANPLTYQRMTGDMDINAGRVVTEDVSLDEVGLEVVDKVRAVASGEQTCSEVLGHREFVLTYKQFEATGPGCFPGVPASTHSRKLHQNQSSSSMDVSDSPALSGWFGPMVAFRSGGAVGDALSLA